jgi:hypothetical protein
MRFREMLPGTYAIVLRNWVSLQDRIDRGIRIPSPSVGSRSRSPMLLVRRDGQRRSFVPGCRQGMGKTLHAEPPAAHSLSIRQMIGSDSRILPSLLSLLCQVGAQCSPRRMAASPSCSNFRQPCYRPGPAANLADRRVVSSRYPGGRTCPAYFANSSETRPCTSLPS